MKDNSRSTNSCASATPEQCAMGQEANYNYEFNLDGVLK